MLKLMRLPHGTNRNRTLRRAVDEQEEEMNFAEVEQLLRQFWRRWRLKRLQPQAAATVAAAASGEEGGSVCA